MAELIMQEEAGTPATPSSTKWKAYFKSSGLYIIDDTGAETGPIGASLTLSAASPRVYTSNDTWSKPAGLSYIIVEVVGGGGGGGGVSGASSQAAVAGGGGGGEYAKARIDAGSLASSESITIGAAGAAGAAGANNGGNGGNSSFGSLVSANGGSGGTGQASTASNPANGAPAGAGGTGGTGGDLHIPGATGHKGMIISTSQVLSSRGGGSHLGGSVSSTGAGTADEAGATGLDYGGGGSGAQTSNDANNRAGGAGAPGVIIVWEYVTS